MNMITYLRSFARNEEGQDLVEYAMLVALIALVCVIGVTSAGSSVEKVFAGIATQILST